MRILAHLREIGILVLLILVTLTSLRVNAMNEEKLKPVAEKTIKSMFPFTRLKFHDWYKLLEFLGIRQLVYPLVFTNKEAAEIIPNLIQKFLDVEPEIRQIYLSQFLQLPMSLEMTKIISIYYQEKSPAKSISWSKFFFLWEKLNRASELSLLTTPFRIFDNRVELYYQKEGKKTYYDYSTNHLINSWTEFRLPSPMFYHFNFPQYKINTWFRIDDVLCFEDLGCTIGWNYKIVFSRKNICIKLTRRAGKKYDLLNKEPRNDIYEFAIKKGSHRLSFQEYENNGILYINTQSNKKNCFLRIEKFNNIASFEEC